MQKVTLVAGALVGFMMATVPHVAAEHITRTYRVTVRTDFGTTFTDCYRFNTPARGEVTIDGLGGASLLYRHGNLDAVLTRFKAVTSIPFGITFFGQFLSDPARIRGEGVNESGDTFTFSGRRNAACSVLGFSTQSRSTSTPYAP
jgi:hypothetical protein